jgi:uncharacterized membrane protein SpoIIM required for sporulation
LKEDGWNLSLELWKKASPMRRRIITILLVFVAIVILTAIATLTPMDEQQAIKTNNDLNQEVNSLKANDSLLQFIFGNNFIITMLMFVPFAGPILGFYILYNTGLVLEASAMAHHLPPTLSFFILFLTPIAWLEFIAYSTAIAGSMWLSARILQKRAEHELANTAKFISVCAVLLLVSAITEASLI